MHSFTKAEFYRAKRKNNTIYNGKSWREGGAGAQLRLHEAPPVLSSTTSLASSERRLQTMPLTSKGAEAEEGEDKHQLEGDGHIYEFEFLMKCEMVGV
jgi:hypothetical protein